MQRVCTYQIAVQSWLDEQDFNATSPVQITVIHRDAAVTLLTTVTDQSGLLGLVSHLHRQGFVILSILREV